MKAAIIFMMVLASVGVSKANAAPVTPSFATGTVTSRTETTTTVREVLRQVDFQTGSIYTATGTNINFTGSPAPGTNYGLLTPGEAFQFSESYLGPGVSRETFIDRETTIDSITDSVSVFTQ